MPIEADDDQEWEENWIVKKLYETEQRKRLSDYELEKGDYVRYIIPRQTGGMIEKRRYTISPERYIVHARKGYAYIIMAEDGQTVTLPRWRLKRCDEKEIRQHPMAETIPKTALLSPELQLVGGIKERRKGEKGNEELRDKETPHGVVEAWMPRTYKRGKKGRKEVADFDEEQEQALTVKRDVFLIDNFMTDHLGGYGLIPPSEGKDIRDPEKSPTIMGDFDKKDGRLFIPIASSSPTGKVKERWILIVVNMKEGEAYPKFYCPEPGGKRNVLGDARAPGRMPDIEEELKEYLMRIISRRVNVHYTIHDFIADYKIAHPGKGDKNLSFLYVAEYCLALFKNEKVPKEIAPERLDELKAELS
jgi:hypothetical protein